MKEIQLQRSERLTIDKIVMGECPEVLPMSTGEQMAAKGGIFITLTFAGGMLAKTVFVAAKTAGKGKAFSAAKTAATQWAQAHGWKVLTAAVAEDQLIWGSGGDVFYYVFPCCDCPPGSNEGGYGSAPIPDINFGCPPGADGVNKHCG